MRSLLKLYIYLPKNLTTEVSCFNLVIIPVLDMDIHLFFLQWHNWQSNTCFHVAFGSCMSFQENRKERSECITMFDNLTLQY